MYKIRWVAQCIVAIFVFLSSARAIGFSQNNPSALLTVAAVVSTTWLIANRTTWLPFLGPTVMPTGIIKPTVPPKSDTSLTIAAPPQAVRCVYWGAVVDANDPIEAYGGFTNAGVADVVHGNVTVRLKRPTSYKIHGKRVAPHVHYRWVGPRGMLSSVKTAYLESV